MQCVGLRWVQEFQPEAVAGPGGGGGAGAVNNFRAEAFVGLGFRVTFLGLDP